MYDLEFAFQDSVAIEPPEFSEYKLELPEGSRILTVNSLMINERGEEEIIPWTMIQLPGSNQYMGYGDWLATQIDIPERPPSEWTYGLFDKDGYDLRVASTIIVMYGEEIVKPIIYIKEDGTNDWTPLNDWEKQQWLLSGATDAALKQKNP